MTLTNRRIGRAGRGNFASKEQTARIVHAGAKSNHTLNSPVDITKDTSAHS
jgi:hypothetical protein